MAELFGFLQQNRDRRGREADWRKTRFAEQRVKNTGFYEEKGITRKEKFFQGRPIIGRDRKINGGVYLGAGEREAVVVDDKKDQAIGRVFQELIKRRREAEARGRGFKDGILEEVWRLVGQVIPYSDQQVENIVSRLPGPDSKVYLSSFIGGGVCRHQALLTGYLLERLSEAGLVGGKVSIDRNHVLGEGGHAWVRYTNSDGDVFILDSAQQYIGRLDEMPDKRDRWFYERPEDTNPKFKLLIKMRRALLGN